MYSYSCTIDQCELNNAGVKLFTKSKLPNIKEINLSIDN